MKTNRLFLLILSVIFSLNLANAQYTGVSGHRSMGGFNYQWFDRYGTGVITLFNAQNKYVSIFYSEKYKDGSPVSDDDILLNRIQLIEDDNWTKQRCISIVDSIFTPIEKQIVKSDNFIISLVIEPDSGRVIEVEFAFSRYSPFIQIPVTTFGRIEMALKSQVWFTTTAVGKQLKVLRRSWSHIVE